MTSSAELFERAELWRQKADAALLEADEHDQRHIESTKNPWSFRISESSTLHERIRLFIWMAELTFRMAVDEREQEEKASTT